MHLLQRIIAVAAVAVAGFVAVPSTQAGAATDPTFDSISWSQPSLTISGTAMVKQTGTIHVTDPSATAGGNCYWYFVLAATGGTGTVTRYTTGATLTSGTVNDGTWTMSFYLSSTADGTWKLTGAATCSDTPQGYDVTGSPSFTVIGHHQPRVSWAVVPTPVPLANQVWQVKGRVYDADTGAGMPNVTVGQAQVDTGCLYQDQGEGDGAQLTLRATTGANGYYQLPVRNGISGLQCIGIVGSPSHNPDGLSVFVWFRPFVVPYLPSVSAAPAAKAVTAGSVDAVNGHVVGGHTGCPIVLQRLYGSTAWRTASTAKLRDSLRFTLTAQPPSVGRFIYRAYYPHCDLQSSLQHAASSSRFTITGS